MRIRPIHLHRPKHILGVKKYLIRLNRDLDSIKLDIKNSVEMSFFYDTTIFPFNTALCNFEICILYLEDRRFFRHGGLELRSFIRGLKRLFSRGSIGGISTVDQQCVRISLERYERTFSRKVNEIILAALLNLHVPKRHILFYYIHNAYTGYQMRGCEVASQKIFGIGAEFLDQEQAAFLASLFPLPFPRVLWEEYSKKENYPYTDPSEIISLGEIFCPRWASRVKYRSAIAIKSYDFKPNSL